MNGINTYSPVVNIQDSFGTGIFPLVVKKF